ncbi:Rieske 2Fe-2S domain-containing protein [Mycobacteroides abscessus subsp. abscessus]|uniref:Rieske 2Fe-2S domain-containing protein n=1 Tax=Mycobacteroides abscessus TaxID=36809 RepID=UPI000927076F|nr:Rieske 2Fe-2S domain-containing protein [Mycobacteroides abscessus]MDO3095932.1 Rieske 2Fe-2S domain-containing protein [Mycobacteroides abscessus subsp. abscessus]PVB48553.1 aromatic ring-hydroxylating dioxygenase subunit alpha [Mycobacteroides abscessus]RIR71174.1 aromatic ring-hydroxylating dioxygenase subunit alpha [Mycobacteroides abscessus]SHX88714.1 ketosteroid-9-alpha-hydroxylase [Mycobacteroides abscessus subsp. abscessus]SHY02263.1 ketosteroid-9-alpha-hydroxylase [Mycobacteroides 
MSTDTAGIGVREIDVGELPTRYARGWHCLGVAESFRDGEPHAIDAFGTKLVVFADTQGDIKVLDGYCRHMGGDLSQGSIKGDNVACPFHDWRWGGDGKCKLVPYAKRTPKLARTRSWITDVKSGLLFVWHDAECNGPTDDVEIPEIPEYSDDGWTTWDWNTIVIEGSNCREIVDNVTDMAHFYYIHFGFPTYFKNVFEGHIASQYLRTVGRPDVQLGGSSQYTGEQILDSEASYFGPSFMINWLHNNYGGYKAESILINCHYPIDQNSFVLQYGVIVQKPAGMDEKMTGKLSRAMTKGVGQGFLQDVEIWKNKTRIDNPLLVEEDGAVYQMRRWYSQFYVDKADVTPEMTDRFELEIDTTKANEFWHGEVDENLQRQALEKEKAEQAAAESGSHAEATQS